MGLETWRHLGNSMWLSSSTLHGKVNRPKHTGVTLGAAAARV
jgi:hypothetical protein